MAETMVNICNAIHNAAPAKEYVISIFFGTILFVALIDCISSIKVLKKTGR